MTDFDYSIEARNVLNKFYGVDKVVYVEGDDDIPFWEVVFGKIADFSVELESVGGKRELLKYAGAIDSGEAEYILAMDSDYDFLSGVQDNPAIIRTYGYSIENTLISIETICKSLKTLLRLPTKDTPRDLCQQWINDFEKSVKKLVLYDILNYKENLGLSVIPVSSDRFMKTKKSCELCENRIDKFLSDLKVDFSEKLEKEESSILDTEFSFFDIVRGHFLFSAVLRFLRVQAESLGRKISISKDTFYSVIVATFESVFSDQHPHYPYYESRLNAVPKSY